MWPWPTWADIISHELGVPYNNWALPGLGNVGIHSRMIECDLRNNFNSNDIILVVWSSWTREDRYSINKSALDGSLWNCTGDVLYLYDKQFIDNYWSISNDAVKNSTAIISANKMFDIKFNGHISTPLTSLYDDSVLCFNEREKDIALFYEPHIPNDGEYQTGKKHLCRYSNDSHPDILSHLSYVQEFLSHKLQLSLSTKTVDFFTEMHYALYVFTKNNIDMGGEDYRRKIPSVLEKFNWKQNIFQGF
jgi:hypothetical protein